jgi:G3E family GTPase
LKRLVPVTVVTGASQGFLAAASATLARTAVVLHDAADGAGASQPAIGCTCCRVSGGLTVTLLDLLRKASRSEVPVFDRVLVSAPAGEGAQVLQEIAASLALGVAFRLEALVTTGAGEDAGIADRIVAGCDANLDPAWIAPMALPDSLGAPGTIRASNDEAIEAFVLGWDPPQALAAVGDWLDAIAGSRGERLLRVHGRSAMDDASVYALNAVRHVVAPPAAIESGDRTSRVRFVTRGLEPNDVLPPWPAGASR